jgi:hypothetical protein
MLRVAMSRNEAETYTETYTEFDTCSIPYQSTKGDSCNVNDSDDNDTVAREVELAGPSISRRRLSLLTDARNLRRRASRALAATRTQPRTQDKSKPIMQHKAKPATVGCSINPRNGAKAHTETYTEVDTFSIPCLSAKGESCKVPPLRLCLYSGMPL